MNVKELFDAKFLRFILVGIINTLFGFSLMFTLYNIFKLGYWGSSFSANVLASIMSFFLNKNYTFRSKDSSVIFGAVKFTVSILICYVLAYGISQRVITYVLMFFVSNLSSNYVEQTAMVFGACIFVFFNYIGQRFFVFKKYSSE